MSIAGLELGYVLPIMPHPIVLESAVKRGGALIHTAVVEHSGALRRTGCAERKTAVTSQLP